jgi:hypothetical protein
MRLPRSHSHNRPTNPRNKPKLKATQKRNSRTKDLGNLHSLGQTIRVEAADCPQGLSGPSASTGQTVRKCHLNDQYCTSKNETFVPYSRTVREQLILRGLSATSGRTVRNTVQPKSTSPTYQTTNAQKQVTNWMNARLSARCGQSSSSMKTRSQPFLSIRGSPKRLELLR